MTQPATTRILVLEDDFHIRNALSRYLMQSGYEVDSAENGRVGLGCIREHRYDIVVSDIMMPEMNGLAFLEHAKAEQPNLDVVMVTGYGDTATAVEAMKIGAADFITKPYQFNYLDSILRGLVEKRRSRSRSAAPDVIELESHLEAKVRELATLYMINEALDSVEGVEAVFETLTRLSAHVCEASRSTAYLVDQEARYLTLHTAYPAETAVLRPGRVPLVGELAVAINERRPPERFSDPMGLRFLESVTGGGQRSASSAVVAPIVVRDQKFGLLILEGKKDAPAFSDKESGFVEIILKKAAMMVERSALYETIYDNLVSTLSSLVRTLEAKDMYTRFHSDRVTRLADLIGREMGISEEDREIMRFAGVLHDVGKIGVSDAVLQKSGPLTSEEFEAIKSHPVVGERILEPLQLLPDERAIIRHHHERWDGHGYPDGLKGTEIPLLVRIVSLADAYDAMTSDRVYRRGLPHDTAVGEIIRNAGRQFDPNVVRAFATICRRHPKDLIVRINESLDREQVFKKRQSLAI